MKEFSTVSTWKEIRFDDLVILRRGKDLTKSKFKKGDIPVAGSNGIIGFHDSSNYRGPGVTIGRSGSCGVVHYYENKFWAHNTVLAVVDFKDNNPKFIFYYLSHLKLDKHATGVSVPTLNRNLFSNLPVFKVPPIEQLKIAYILSTLQNAIEKQQQIIDTTQALKKSLLHQLFSQGAKGEKLKETEIGMMPGSWLAVEIGSVLIKSTQRNPSGKPDEMFKYVDVSGVSNQSFSITTFSSVKGKDAPSRARKVMLENDILFATVRPTLQRIAIVPKELNDEICSTGYCVLRPDAKKIISDFLYYYLQSNMILRKMEEMQKGASYPAVSDSNIKECLFPLAPMAEQEFISKSLNALTNKISVSLKKKEVYESLFKTLLNDLMTGGIRVDQLEFDLSLKNE